MFQARFAYVVASQPHGLACKAASLIYKSVPCFGDAGSSVYVFFGAASWIYVAASYIFEAYLLVDLQCSLIDLQDYHMIYDLHHGFVILPHGFSEAAS